MFRRRFCDVQGNSHGSRSMRYAMRRRAADTVRALAVVPWSVWQDMLMVCAARRTECARNL